MDLNVLLSRIDDRQKALGLSDTRLSRMAGSADIVRNWRRAARSGQAMSPRHDVLEKIAEGLGVDVAWLTDGRSIDAPAGLSETAAPYTVRRHPTAEDDPQGPVRAIFGPQAHAPGTVVAPRDLPAFGVLRGDVLVADLARLPAVGELALVTAIDAESHEHTTHIYRYLPPFLVAGDLAGTADPLRVDHPQMMVRCAVVGLIRGIS